MAMGHKAALRCAVVVMGVMAATGCHPGYNSELMQASVHGDEAKVRNLLGNYANVNYTDHDGDTALHAAAEYGHPEIIRTLVQQGKANVDRRDSDGKTPLHFAAEHGQLAAVKALLEVGARPNVRDNDGWTPLHFAADAESPEMVILLISKGADPNGINGDGQTPVQVAAQNEDKDDAEKDRTVAALRSHGAKD